MKINCKKMKRVKSTSPDTITSESRIFELDNPCDGFLKKTSSGFHRRLNFFFHTLDFLWEKSSSPKDFLTRGFKYTALCFLYRRVVMNLICFDKSIVEGFCRFSVMNLVHYKTEFLRRYPI